MRLCEKVGSRQYAIGSLCRLYCLLLTACCLLFSAPATAQLVQMPIGHGNVSALKKNSTSARMQSLDPMVLPFWDDFSFTQQKDYANDTLWVSRKTVWVNSGVAINPPSIFTATFDGIDSTGKPYNIIEVLAKGFADKLVSRPIKLDALSASQADSVYLSFFYQVTGNGEAPDTDDNFSLWFKDVNGTWEKVFEVGNSINLDPTKFYYINLKVDQKYFYGNFQFKFQNFSRLSGPYDTWNLDYVYLNKRRKASDNYFFDRSSVKPLSSIFQKYTSIPIKHYKDTAKAVTISPKATFYNLFLSHDPQPSDYTTFARIIMKTAFDTVEKYFRLDSAFGIGILEPGVHTEVTLNKTVPVDSLNLSADSIFIDFKLGFDSGDTNTVAETPYFFPVDFVKNDTIHSEFILHNYYAYDDGSAEYGAGMNSAGAELAYGFDMFTKAPDTVASVDIYFPQFGDPNNPNLILKLWNSNAGIPNTELYRQTIPVKRTSGNRFTRYNLDEPVGVKGRFFIGWEQSASYVIPAGLDKNTSSGEEIYFNTTGTWEQNQTVTGSLMIRPVFGKGAASVVTAIRKEEKSNIFPNPNQGEFYIPSGAQNINITNILGIAREFSTEQEHENKRVILDDKTPGIILVRWQMNGKMYSAKALVRN